MRLRRLVRGMRPAQTAATLPARLDEPELLLRLTDTIDALNRRVERLEVSNEFERELRRGAK